MVFVDEHRHLPNINRLSVLSAVILLGYALMHYLEAPGSSLELQILGVYLPIRFNINTLLSLLVGGLAASGVDWLLRDHPNLEGRSTFRHWILPALTAWVIGVPLYSLPHGLIWWGAFVLASLLLISVFTAEYISVDPSDMLYPLASAGLTGIAYALFLILAIAMHAANARLYVLLPALFVAAGLIGLRNLFLRLGDKHAIPWAIGIAITTAQFVAGLHYFPITSIRFGMLVLGPLFALISLAGSLEEGKPRQNWLFEPLFMMIFLWGLGLWLG